MRRLTLRVFVASIVVGACIGLWSLLVGEFGEFQARVLSTSFCTIAASLLISACMAARDQRRNDIAPGVGIAAAILGFGMIIAAIWVDIYEPRYYEVAIIAIISAISLAHISLLSLARLVVRWRWVMGLAMLSSLTLAGLCIAFIYWTYPPDWIWRLVGSLFIVVSATSIATPILHYLSRDEDVVGADIRFCPACGHRAAADVGLFTCGRCRASYQIELPPPQ